MQDLQEALRHAPGRATALMFFEPLEASSAGEQSASRLERQVSADARTDPLRRLLGLGEDVAKTRSGYSVLIALTGASSLGLELGVGQPPGPWGKRPVLVQVGAPSPVGRLYLQRRVDAIMAPAFALREELQGERLAHGLEAFGFSDHDPAPAAPRPDPDSLRGQCWLLYAKYSQRIGDFFANGAGKRAEVVGALPGFTAQFSPSDQGAMAAAVAGGGAGHKASMRSHAPEWRPIVRRGFPFRRDGQEGLAFLGACSEGVHLEAARKAAESDELLSKYSQLLEHGYYYCPTPDQLRSLPSPSPSDSARALDTGPLVAYEVPPENLNYWALLLESGILDGPVGNMTIDPQVHAALKTAHAALAVKRPGSASVQELDAALDAMLGASNGVNRSARVYITKG